MGIPTRRAAPSKKRRRQRRVKVVKCRLTKEQNDFLDYKDVPTLEYFISQQGKILSRKRTGCNAQQQRMVAQAIKVARHMALLPFVAK